MVANATLMVASHVKRAVALPTATGGDDMWKEMTSLNGDAPQLVSSSNVQKMQVEARATFSFPHPM